MIKHDGVQISERILSRRDFSKRAAAVLAAATYSPKPAQSVPRIRAGAIRWDAWSAVNSSVRQAVATSLQPPQYRARAPFCAAEGKDTIDFAACATQSSMEFEIAAAVKGGIDYWAYVWYGHSDPMMNAWSRHQHSAHRNRVNWCLVLPFDGLGGPTAFVARIAEYLAYFRQPNYQRAIAARPLVYLFAPSLDPIKTQWADSWAKLHASLQSLGAACAIAGLGSPYWVVMSGDPATACRMMRDIGADSISNYIAKTPVGTPSNYSDLDMSARAYWVEMAATGAQIVPICMTGWDTRPRKLHPPPWDHNQRHDAGMNTYVAAGTPVQIARHIEAALAYVEGHPAVCPATTIMIYSWDECDEGGSPLIPTYTPSGPNHAILDAIGGVLKRR